MSLTWSSASTPRPRAALRRWLHHRHADEYCEFHDITTTTSSGSEPEDDSITNNNHNNTAQDGHQHHQFVSTSSSKSSSASSSSSSSSSSLRVPSNRDACSNSIQQISTKSNSISNSLNSNRSKGVLLFATAPTDQGGIITTDRVLQLVRGGLTWSTVPGLILPEDADNDDDTSCCGCVTKEHQSLPDNNMQLQQQEPLSSLPNTAVTCCQEEKVDDISTSSRSRNEKEKVILLSRKLAPPPSAVNNNTRSSSLRSWKRSTTATSSKTQSSSSSPPPPCSPSSSVPCSSSSSLPASPTTTESSNSSNSSSPTTRRANSPASTAPADRAPCGNRHDLKDYLSLQQQQQQSLLLHKQLLFKASSMDDTTASTTGEDESEASAASPDMDVEVGTALSCRQPQQLQPLLTLPDESVIEDTTTDDHDDCPLVVVHDKVHDVAHSAGGATGSSPSSCQDDASDDSESSNSSTNTSTSSSDDEDEDLSDWKSPSGSVDESYRTCRQLEYENYQQQEKGAASTTTASKTSTLRWADEVHKNDDGRTVDLETIYSIECLQPISTRVVILLLNPKERLFEFIQCEYNVDDRLTISDLLKQLPGMASIDVLAKQRYTSLCRLDEEMINMLSIQDYPVREGEILIGAGNEYRPKMVMAAACALLSQRALLRAVHKAKLSGRALQKLSSSKELAQAQAAAKLAAASSVGVAKPNNNKEEEEEEESEEEEDNNILIVKVLSREYGDSASSSPTVPPHRTTIMSKPNNNSCTSPTSGSSSLELEPQLSGSYDEEFLSYDEEFLLSIPSVESDEFKEMSDVAGGDDDTMDDNLHQLYAQQQQQRRIDLETQLPVDWQTNNVLSTLPTLPLLFQDLYKTPTQHHDDDTYDCREEAQPESDYQRPDDSNNHLVDEDSYDEDTFGYI